MTTNNESERAAISAGREARSPIQGYYQVRQLLGKKGATEEFMRSFDAAEWAYQWVDRFGHQVLRLERTGIESLNGSFEVAEFSAPVNIELILEDA